MCYLVPVTSARHVRMELCCFHFLRITYVDLHCIAFEPTVCVWSARVSVDVAIAPHVPRLGRRYGGLSGDWWALMMLRWGALLDRGHRKSLLVSRRWGSRARWWGKKVVERESDGCHGRVDACLDACFLAFLPPCSSRSGLGGLIGRRRGNGRCRRPLRV